MSLIGRDQRWTLCGGLEFNATGQREILASGTGLAYGEEVEVVRADAYRGAVHERDVFARALALAQPNERAREALIAAAEKALASPPAGGQ